LIWVNSLTNSTATPFSLFCAPYFFYWPIYTQQQFAAPRRSGDLPYNPNVKMAITVNVLLSGYLSAQIGDSSHLFPPGAPHFPR